MCVNAHCRVIHVFILRAKYFQASISAESSTDSLELFTRHLQHCRGSPDPPGVHLHLLQPRDLPLSLCPQVRGESSGKKMSLEINQTSWRLCDDKLVLMHAQSRQQ